MSKGPGPTPRTPQRPRPIPDGGTGGPETPLEPCATEVLMAAVFEVDVAVGDHVITIPTAQEVVLQVGSRRVGVVAPPDDARVRSCASRRWIYEGTVTENGRTGLVTVHGIRR
jgi:hypothetical protein